MAGAGPIPWTAIDRFCERNGYTREEQRELLEYIRALDAEFLKTKEGE